eukprot:4245141-Amphidinium_carterae.2
MTARMARKSHDKVSGEASSMSDGPAPYLNLHTHAWWPMSAMLRLASGKAGVAAIALLMALNVPPGPHIDLTNGIVSILVHGG